MKKITVVGLGPGNPDFLTVKAIEKLKTAQTLYIRTEKHPTNHYLKSLGIEYETFDSLYESEETFDDVYQKIVDELIAQAADKPITYAIPGNPFVAERTVELLQEQYEDLEFIYGVSFIDAVLTVLKIDPVNGLAVGDALSLKELSNQNYNMIIKVYNKMVVANLKIELSRYYEDDQEVVIVKSAGIESQEEMFVRKLWEIDHYDDYDHLTTFVIYPVEESMRRKKFDDLVQIMRTLRGDEGCPWDRKQTHQSLRKYLLEEAYEVLEAIDLEDSVLLEEELGDVLLQIVFHGLIEEEMGYFNLDDVTNTLSQKLIRRHPHIFGNETADSPEEVEKIWAGVKQEEKPMEYSERMNSITKSSPGLFRAAKVQKIAREVGFDWDDVYPALDKVLEELDELKVEIQEENREKIEEELGDLIFAVVNVARLLKLDSELALNLTIKKFINRFAFIEHSESAKNKGIENLTLAEMDNIWEESKNKN